MNIVSGGVQVAAACLQCWVVFYGREVRAVEMNSLLATVTYKKSNVISDGVLAY